MIKNNTIKAFSRFSTIKTKILISQKRIFVNPPPNSPIFRGVFFVIIRINRSFTYNPTCRSILHTRAALCRSLVHFWRIRLFTRAVIRLIAKITSQPRDRRFVKLTKKIFLLYPFIKYKIWIQIINKTKNMYIYIYIRC